MVVVSHLFSDKFQGGYDSLWVIPSLLWNYLFPGSPLKSNCLVVKILQGDQLNLASLLRLKQSIRKSTFGENIVVIVVSFS